MRKTNHKTHYKITQALAHIQRETSQFNGFSHFTFSAVWHDFPASLIVVCHFVDQAALEGFMGQEQNALMQKIIHRQLLKIGVNCRHIHKNIAYQVAPSDD